MFNLTYYESTTYDFIFWKRKHGVTQFLENIKD